MQEASLRPSCMNKLHQGHTHQTRWASQMTQRLDCQYYRTGKCISPASIWLNLSRECTPYTSQLILLLISEVTHKHDCTGRQAQIYFIHLNGKRQCCNKQYTENSKTHTGDGVSCTLLWSICNYIHNGYFDCRLQQWHADHLKVFLTFFFTMERFLWSFSLVVFCDLSCLLLLLRLPVNTLSIDLTTSKPICQTVFLNLTIPPSLAYHLFEPHQYIIMQTLRTNSRLD